MLFCSTKKVIDKGKTGGKVVTLEVAEVALVQFIIVDNQYQQKSKVLYSYTQ